MQRHLSPFPASLGAVALAALCSAASAQECGTVTIANMTWPSAEVLANIDQIILNAGYGCDAELVPGDTVPTFSSMNERGQPDLAPELWTDTIREPLAEAIAEGRLIRAAETLADGGEQGWYVPKYVVDAHPEIVTINDALARPDLFPAPEDASKGAVYNCPVGWACEILTANLFRAYQAEEKGFVLVDTGSAAGLDGTIARAYERGEPWLGYYWAPTSILGKYEMVKLDEGAPHDPVAWGECISLPDCADPQPNAFPTSDVYAVVTRNFAETAGVAMEYVGARKWGNDTVNELLAWMSDNQASGEEGAEYFLRNNEDVWTQWVPADVAERVKAAL